MMEEEVVLGGETVETTDDDKDAMEQVDQDDGIAEVRFGWKLVWSQHKIRMKRTLCQTM